MFGNVPAMQQNMQQNMQQDMQQNLQGDAQRLAWTQERAQRAAEQGNYIYVPKTGRTLLLAGTHRMWNRPEPANIIYHSGYRIAGTPNDVQNALLQAGVDRQTIDQVLATSLAANNYNTNMQQVYNDTLASDLNIREQHRNKMEPIKKAKVDTVKYNALIHELEILSNYMRQARNAPREQYDRDLIAGYRLFLNDLRQLRTTVFRNKMELAMALGYTSDDEEEDEEEEVDRDD